MAKTIAVIGALDTKGQEFAFVKEEIENRGHHALVINVGVVGEPSFKPDIPAETVAQASGVSLKELRDKADRGLAIEAMLKGIVKVVEELYDQDKIDGIISMGGGAGTDIGTAAMRKLPLGVPKVMVSTLASGDTKPYVGTRDVVMFPSIVDVAGINRISAPTFANAAGAIVGMVETASPKIEEKPLLAATMFGNTTPIVDRCRGTMENQGYEVLVFHAVGAPETVENLVEEGYIVGLLDITTTEWADQITGGVCPGGANRYDVMGGKGIPQVIVPGCLDMANFWAKETVPDKYDGRLFNEWAPNVTLMRTNEDENEEMGQVLAQKANRSKGPVAFFLPLKGVSMLDAPGKEFWWPEANRALFDSIKKHLEPHIPVYELDNNINDDEFADAVSEKMLEFLKEK
jgi:uncharacterized protein (UPF0261 family)